MRRVWAGLVVVIAAACVPASAAAAAGPVWATGVPLALPTGAATAPGSQSAALQAVACFGHGSCEGVGAYTVSASDAPLMAVSETNGRWGSPLELTLPGNAFASSSFGPTATSMACVTQGDCVAVGYYQIDGDGDELPVVFTQSAGVWGKGGTIKLPAGAATVPDAAWGPWFSQLSSVTCTSVGNCVAVGQYSDAAGNVHAMAVAEVRGQWGSATEIADPSDSDERYSSLSGVSCTSVGYCEAVGAVTTAADGQLPMVVSESGGVWGRASEVVQPSNATTDPGLVTSDLMSVSCVSRGSCEAVGFYVDAESLDGEDLQPMVAAETSGTWQQATEIALPAGATTAGDEYAWLDSVSCVTAGNCEAGGAYEDSEGEQLGVFANESDGVWGAATDLTLPAGAATPPDASSYISSVTCTSLDSCDAGGEYETSTGNSLPLFIAGVPTLSLTGRALPAATVGKSYSAALSSTGGTGNDTWSIVSGSLPPGLKLGATTGVISGTPTAVRYSTFTIALVDHGPPLQNADASFSITVAPPRPGRPQ